MLTLKSLLFKMFTCRFRFIMKKQLSDLSPQERFTFFALGKDKGRWFK